MGSRSFNYFEAGSALNPLYVAWRDETGFTPSAANEILLNDFFIALQSPIDESSEIDYFYLYPQEDESQSMVSLFNPSLFSLSKLNGGPNWVQYFGYQYIGTVKILNANYTESTDRINYDQQAGTVGYLQSGYVVSNVGMSMGARNSGGGGSRFRTKQLLGGQQRMQFQSSSILNLTGPSDANGFWAHDKTGTTVSSYQNGSFHDSGTLAGSTLTNVSDYLGSVNNNGTIINTQDACWHCHFKAGNLSAAYIAQISAALKTYTDAIGLNVIP